MMRCVFWDVQHGSAAYIATPAGTHIAVDLGTGSYGESGPEFSPLLHLKDQRGSGTEPVNVLSRYRYQDGLGYYESTRDTGSHFFIDYLPKGTYVFEYSVRVQQCGRYQSGMAQIQCMYAPEFNSHSQSFTLTVQ